MGALWNPVLDTILAHRSVRAFAPRGLPDGAVETIVAAAQSASTSSNLQLWSVIAVEDPDRRARLATLAHNQRHVAQAPLQLVWICDLSRLHRLGTDAGRPARALDYLECLMLGVVDTALAAQTAMIAVESMGLNAVYIGAMRDHPEDVARELSLPPRAFAVFGMCVGYADLEQPAQVKPRLPQSAVLHREQYGTPDEAVLLQRYDGILRAFNEGQGRPQGWIDPTLSRVAGPESLLGRDRLRTALELLGFPMR